MRDTLTICHGCSKPLKGTETNDVGLCTACDSTLTVESYGFDTERLTTLAEASWQTYNDEGTVLYPRDAVGGSGNRLIREAMAGETCPMPGCGTTMTAGQSRGVGFDPAAGEVSHVIPASWWGPRGTRGGYIATRSSIATAGTPSLVVTCRACNAGLGEAPITHLMHGRTIVTGVPARKRTR